MAVIYMTGLLQDGAPLSPSVRQNPRAALRVTQGGSYTLRLTVVNPAGQRVDLSGGVTYSNSLAGAFNVKVKNTISAIAVTQAFTPSA